MSQHAHVEFVPGCFRCELGRDEVLAIEAVDAIAPWAARLAEEAPAIVELSVGHGYALVKRS